jgi:hypothetical protein
MKFRQTLGALVLAAGALNALNAQNPDPDVAAKPTGAPAPAGWQVRLDRANADRAALAFTMMGPGMHVTSGPAATLWNPANTASGAFTAEVTMTQMKAPTHAEAYGIVWGGRDLAAETQEYLYFLVRKDGRYTVRHRAGGATHDVTPWTEHVAVVKEGADGKARNTLRVEVTATSTKLYANGQLLQELPRTGMTAGTDGIVGLRVNHNLDVHIDGFAVRR